MNTLSKVKEGDVEIRDIYDYIVGYELNWLDEFFDVLIWGVNIIG